MKLLLQAIQTELRFLEYIRDGDVFISPHVDFYPNYVRFPCIGIKDGNIEREAGFSETLRQNMTVQIAIFVNLPQDIESVIVGENGVLDIEQDIHELLDDNGFDRFDSAFCEMSEESNLISGAENDIKQQKILIYKYEKECEPR